MPPNLKAQLHGLLTNNKWVLINDQDDTITIFGNKSYRDSITLIQYGNSNECEKEYHGKRYITFRDIYNFQSELSAFSVDRKKMSIYSPFISFEWDLQSDDWQANSVYEVEKLDSINVGNQTYYNPFYNPDGFIWVLSPKIGPIAILDANENIDFKLIHYE